MFSLKAAQGNIDMKIDGVAGMRKGVDEVFVRLSPTFGDGEARMRENDVDVPHLYLHVGQNKLCA